MRSDTHADPRRATNAGPRGQRRLIASLAPVAGSEESKRTTIPPVSEELQAASPAKAKEEFRPRAITSEADDGVQDSCSPAIRRTRICSRIKASSFLPPGQAQERGSRPEKIGHRQTPNDAFTQATLGIVYYRMGRYDDAMTLSHPGDHASTPKNATAHAYLGITSSQKGWPEAGLEELQKAVALNPNYADAHFNIAVIYATNQPPSKDRARESYKTAISLGASPDPNLEKLIDQKNAR